MDDLLPQFEQLKISAIDKVRKINQTAYIPVKQNGSKNEMKKYDLIKIQEDVTIKDHVNNNDVPVRHLLKEIEFQRQEKVKNVVQTRITELQDFSNNQMANKKRVWLKKQQAFIENMLQKESTILQVLNECDKNNLKERNKLDQHYHDLAERRKVQETELRARERDIQNLHTNIDSVRKYQQEFRLLYERLITIIKSCTKIDELKSLLGDDFKLLKSLPQCLDDIINKCKDGKVNEEEVQKAANVVIQMTNLKSKVEIIVEGINKEENKAVQESPVYSEPPSVSTEVSTNNENLQSKHITGLNKPEKSSLVTTNITKYVSLSNLKIYTQAMEFLENHTLSFQDLEKDQTRKSFIFECKKAVNIPVNSISGISSGHILDKYNRLYQLLIGQDVLVNGKLINASSHPQGIPFCMDLLAKKFVLQGDLMVSSNPESAFCYASVIISLWNEFPILGQLIMAYFYKFCPYLVPYYIPKQIGESDEEFYKKQGYQYTDGQIEKQDKFLKRMTGIMRLYAAILITKPKKGQTKTPHNILHGWRWLSSTLKLEPRVDITATMLHTFLDTLGFEMETRYGRPFRKLNNIIIQIFLPSCRQKCTGGAVTRLELLLSEHEKDKSYKQPNGYLPYCSW